MRHYFRTFMGWCTGRSVLAMAASSAGLGARLRAILQPGRGRKTISRRALVVAALLTAMGVAALATVHTQPRSLEEALTWPRPSVNTPAGEEADIAFLTAQIRKFGDGDPWAGKAYYALGEAQLFTSHDSDALASFNRCLQLPEPPYANSGIHLAAWHQGVYALQWGGHDKEALARIAAFQRSSAAGPEGAELTANLRAWEPELRQEASRQASRAATRAYYAALAATPGARWTQTLANGVSVRLVGVEVSQGHRRWAYDPNGRILRESVFQTPEDASDTLPPGQQSRTCFVLQLSYAPGRVVKAACESSDLQGLVYDSGVTNENGAVLTDEAQINPDTAGLRLIDVTTPAGQRRATFRYGVAVGAPAALPPDAPDPAYQWATFTNIILPPRPTAQLQETAHDQ